MSDIDLLAALAESIERAKQRRRDAIPCDKCGGDRLRPDFTVSESCHAPIGRAESSDTFGAPGRVSGVVVCSYHRSVLGGLRTAHGSVEGHAGRVRQIAGQCCDCLREQEESG